MYSVLIDQTLNSRSCIFIICSFVHFIDEYQFQIYFWNYDFMFSILFRDLVNVKRQNVCDTTRHLGRRDTTRIVAKVVCLGQDSLMVGSEFRVLLLDWLPLKARNSIQLCYVTPSRKKRWIHTIFKSIWAKVSVTTSAGIRIRHADLSH